MPDKRQRISQMVFCGGYIEIHPSCSKCISRFCTQHQGGSFSIWEGGGTKKGGRDKESIKDHPPATLGRVDYMDIRLYQADQEMSRMFGEDR